jgi:hypothetical protein
MADHDGPATPSNEPPDTAPAWATPAGPQPGQGAPPPYGGNPPYPGAPYQGQQQYPGQQPPPPPGPGYPGAPYQGQPGPGSGPYTPPPFPGQQGPYTPPPFPQPGQPGPGGFYQGGPPPKKGNGLLIGLLAGGGVFVVILIVVVLLVSGVFGGKTESASKRLQDAAKSLSTAKGVKYNGQITSTDATLSGAFEVTSSGKAGFTGSWSDSQISFLDMGDNQTYVKGDATFWDTKADFSPTNASDYIDGKRWGRLSSYKMNFDFNKNLTPTAISQQINQISSYSIKSTVKTKVGGTSAQKITTYEGSYYVSASGTPKLLRVESTGYPSYALDLDSSSPDTVSTDLKSKVGELKNSFDGSYEPTTTETGSDNCRHSATACTVTVHVFQSRTGSTGSVPVNVHVWLTADTSTGKKIDTCDQTGSISSSSTDVICTMSSSGWKSWAGSGTGTKWFYYHATAVVGGASDGDIQAMQTALDAG